MKKILILDDESSIRESFDSFFEDEGFEVFSFSEPHEALSYLENNSIPIAIVDIRLPKITGDEFIIQANKIWPEMKFVIYTGSNNFELSDSLKKIGITSDDVFHKPVSDIMVILERVNFLG